MRWLVWIAILLGASETSARKLVIMDPPMVRQCPRAKTFTGVMACLAKHGTAKLMREVRGGKLVKLSQPGMRNSEGTVLLYVERKGEWQIGGLFQAYGGEFQILALEPVTVGKRSGYRLDIGQVNPFTLVVDGVSPVIAQLRTRRSLYCSGDSYSCADATIGCEISVAGRAWYTFRGTPSIGDNMVLIKGDRTHAGPNCGASDKIYLGWTQPP